MRLNDWMSQAGATDQTLADTIGRGIDRSTISRIRRGKRMPSAELMRLIHEATGGAVTANDFVHSAEAA